MWNDTKNARLQWLWKNSLVRRTIVVLMVLALVVVFPEIYREVGSRAGAMITAIVLISTILLGMKGGLLVWAVTILLFASIVSPAETIANWPGVAATLVLTIIIGVARNYMTTLSHDHKTHVLSTEDRLTKINNCLLTFDADPIMKIKRLTSLACELLGGEIALYTRNGNGRCTTIGFRRGAEFGIAEHDAGCAAVNAIVDNASDDVLVIERFHESRYRDAITCVPESHLRTYAGKSVRIDDGHTGTLSVLFDVDVNLGTAEKEILGILASAIAVEEKRMQFETSSRESELSYIDLFNTVTEAIYILDENLTFVNVNAGALRMYGHTRGELIGKMPAFVGAAGLNDMDRIAGLILGVFETGVPVSFDFWGKRKNGDTFPKEVYCSKGKYFGRDVIIATARDLTEQRRMQEQLMQSQKLESLGTLTGGIAHDFNNLLAMVLGSAELLQHQVSGQPELKKYIDRIIEASERGTSISRQLLMFSRPDQRELKPVLPSKIIAELKGMLSHFLAKSIAIDTEIDDDTRMILGDSGQVHQALLNLALNARDAMENAGTLSIRQHAAAPEDVKKRFPLAAPIPYVAISVSDTGAGMEASVIARIFDPFFSTKDPGKGTGLGLAMVHGIMKNHNGYIDVTSAPGAGTTFALYFPALESAAETAAVAQTAPVHERGATILLVDDEEHIREMLAEFLTGEGYNIISASNGKDALELYTMHHRTIDLVITDLGMPGMGGEELFGHLTQINPDVKVMVASGYLDGFTKEHLLAMGIRDVLTKPSKLKDTHAAIRTALQGN